MRTQSYPSDITDEQWRLIEPHIPVYPGGRPRTTKPRDADGVCARLGEGDIVEEEQALGAGEGLGQVSAVAFENALVIPGARVDELLEGLLGIGAGEPLGELDAAGEGLDGLALAIEQESLEVHAGKYRQRHREDQIEDLFEDSSPVCSVPLWLVPLCPFDPAAAEDAGAGVERDRLPRRHRR